MALVNLKLTSTGSQWLGWEIPKITNNVLGPCQIKKLVSYEHLWGNSDLETLVLR